MFHERQLITVFKCDGNSLVYGGEQIGGVVRVCLPFYLVCDMRMSRVACPWHIQSRSYSSCANQVVSCAAVDWSPSPAAMRATYMLPTPPSRSQSQWPTLCYVYAALGRASDGCI